MGLGGKISKFPNPGYGLTIAQLITQYQMPFFVALAQTGGTFDGVQIEYMPITEPPQMAALLSKAEVDVW